MKHKKPFIVKWPDSTAIGNMASIKFDPLYDRVPSSGELVNTQELAIQYLKEIYRLK